MIVYIAWFLLYYSSASSGTKHGHMIWAHVTHVCIPLPIFHIMYMSYPMSRSVQSPWCNAESGDKVSSEGPAPLTYEIFLYGAMQKHCHLNYISLWKSLVRILAWLLQGKTLDAEQRIHFDMLILSKVFFFFFFIPDAKNCPQLSLGTPIPT